MLAYTSMILSKAGYKTGRYVSPTVISYLEKIQMLTNQVFLVGIVIFHAVFSPPVLQSIILSNFIWKNCRYGMEWIAWRLWHAEFRETNCG